MGGSALARIGFKRRRADGTEKQHTSVLTGREKVIHSEGEWKSAPRGFARQAESKGVWENNALHARSAVMNLIIYFSPGNIDPFGERKHQDNLYRNKIAPSVHSFKNKELSGVLTLRVPRKTLRFRALVEHFFLRWLSVKRGFRESKVHQSGGLHIIFVLPLSPSCVCPALP